MALSFPLDLPTSGVAKINFNIQRVDFRSPEAGGRPGGIQSGFPLWRLSITLQDTDTDETDDWAAFVDALRGALFTFVGRDLSRPYPKAYPHGFAGLVRAGGGAFDGSATSWSVNTAGDVLTVGGLPANMPFAKRDYVGFKYGATSRALARFAQAGTADGSGNLVLPIEPPLPAVVPSLAVCHFDNPGCIMRLSPTETMIGDIDVNHSLGGTIVGVQDLLS